ncbi:MULTISPECIES: pyrroline-5-carboxylate reductase [unclassified Thioalkalivibrio]|uniref:pyrroline-5-carboxylate reductase n=1 Tax=unclassified Thioalkalivibrio TaxID=2621013 RepID=UPI000376E8DD|nr:MULTISPECIES: pyrroline-5-carboxylate reductase [unclassified Thioalkalivibrio]
MTEHRFEVGFVGAGNMGEALLQGLVQSGHDAERIAIADKSAERVRDLQARYPGLQAANPETLAEGSATLVLAVKPQTLPDLAPTLREAVARGQPLVISVAAGITTAQLAGWLGDDTRLVRAMPNTPALVGAGVTGLFAAPTATAEDRDTANRLLESVGRAIPVADEELMHAVTATSGSGPAYVFMMIEAMQDAAQSLGLPPDTALELTLGTLAGATRLAAESDEPPAELRHRVTSPGGTTERALQVLEDGDLRGLMRRAMAAAAERSRELGQ